MIKSFIILLSILYLNTAFIVFETEKSKEKNKPEIKVNFKFDKDKFDDDDDYDEPMVTTRGPALAGGCAFHIFWRCASNENCMNYVWHPFCVNGRCCGRTIPEEHEKKHSAKIYQQRFNGRK